MIEPMQAPSAAPVVDVLTRRVAGALRRGRTGAAWRGWHTCSCGVKSDNCDHYVQFVDGTWVLTNSLATHYAAWHRHEICPVDIDRISKLAGDGVEPATQELNPPPTNRSVI